MAKDFAYWRRSFIAYRFDRTNADLEFAEEYTGSPIEKITYLQIAKMFNLYGMYHLAVATQKEIGSFKVDFEITYEFNKEQYKKIVIECDGHEFHEKTKEQSSKDKKRDRELQKLGYTILRYSGSDIVNNPFQITKDLVEILGQPEWAVQSG